MRAAPADAPVFWPTQTKRRRGAVADLADAMTRGPARRALAALGGLLRELYAYPDGVVAAGDRGDRPIGSVPAVRSRRRLLRVAGRARSRAMGGRAASTYGVGLHPVDEAREAAYDVPGSLLALPSAVTRRVRPVRFDIPDQPLLWMALVVTLLTTIPLLDRQDRDERHGRRRRSASRSPRSRRRGCSRCARSVRAAGTVRATASRSTYPATINGEDVRTVDVSPSGHRRRRRADDARTRRARRGNGHLRFGVRGRRRARARHRPSARRRPATRSVSRSISPRTNASPGFASCSRPRWLTGAVPDPTRVRRHAPRRVFNAGQPAVAAAPARRRSRWSPSTGVSVLVLGALLLALLGYRPMVVRSGSMVPTLGIGDVVIANWVHVDRDPARRDHHVPGRHRSPATHHASRAEGGRRRATSCTSRRRATPTPSRNSGRSRATRSSVTSTGGSRRSGDCSWCSANRPPSGSCSRRQWRSSWLPS